MTKAFLFSLLSFLAAGCASTSHSVKVLPAPIQNFPPTAPALVRLPVVLLFPSGAEVIHHITDFFKNELTLKMDIPVAATGLHMKFHLTDFWSAMQKPIFLYKDVWLLIRPQALSVGSMRLDPRNILTAHTALEMTAQPELVFGPKPEAKVMKMPPVGKFIPGPPVFQAVSNSFIGYPELNEHLRDPRMKLIGMVLRGTGQKVTIDAIRAYGSGGQVVVELKLHYEPLILNLGSKPAKLTIYLKGTPRYLPRSEAFDLPDLDYDIQSSDLMVQMADMLFKGDFRKQLRKIVRLPVGPKMDELKGKIDRALNRPLGNFIRLSAKVDSFKVLNGFANNEGIVIRVSLQGTAALEITWN
jgi:hypothetical protein